jgi:hypothetical protein
MWSLVVGGCTSFARKIRIQPAICICTHPKIGHVIAVPTLSGKKHVEKDAWIEHDLDKCETKFTVITVYPKNKVQGRRFNQHLTHPKDPV